ncbi:MAG: chitinase [Chitinophagaceae bacterium]|nr:chitinase [Chitinophagaceae bacterium]
MKKNIFTVLLIQLLFYTVQAQSPRVMGYFPSDAAGWENNVQYTKLTDLVVAFLNPDNSGDLQYTGAFSQTSFNLLLSNARSNGVRVFISSGGASTVFSTTAADPAARTNYIAQVISFIHTNDLDGFDLDWEFPKTTTDKDNHELLLHDMRHALDSLYTLTGKKVELSIAVGGELGHTAYLNSNALQYIDLLNVMAYDAPASAGPNHSSMTFAENAVTIWNGNMLVPKNKIMLGVPFYGRPTAGNSSYQTFNALSSGNPSAAYNADYYNNEYYNGAPTLQTKASYVQSNGLAGIMIWQLGQDRTDQYSLLSAIYEITSQSTAVPGMSVNITTPTNNASYQFGTYVTVSADAAFSGGSISKVEFYNGNVKLGEDLTAPYTYTIRNIAAGTYPLKAIATNNLSQQVSSLIVSITVASPCSAANWIPSGVYTTNTQAAYNNNIYKAKWWNTNTKPDSIMAANPWLLIGSCAGASQAFPPAAPATLTAFDNGNQEAALTWNRSANVSYYVIERSITSGSAYAAIDTIGTNDSLYTDELLSTGTYYYQVYAVNSVGASGASNEAQVTLTVTGIDESAIPSNNFYLYPNPSSTGGFNLYSKGTQSGEIEICDLTGKVIYRTTITGERTKVESTLPSGIYFVKLSGNNASVPVQKLLVP